MSKRDEVVSIARACVGPQDPDRFWRVVRPALMGQPTKISWCGGFALWALRVAGLCDWDWVIWKGGNSPSGFLYRLPITIEPEPGDMAYYRHLSHHAIVAKVNGDNIETIDGNQKPGESVQVRQKTRAQVTAFYSIAPLLPESERFTGEPPTVPDGVEKMPTVRNGSSGPAVKLLQERLAYWGWNLIPDGKWGPMTANAVFNFQKDHGLTADGVVGRQTWRLLFKDIGS